MKRINGIIVPTVTTLTWEHELDIEKCLVKCPGKKIMLGVFMQDIGLSDLGYDPRLVLRYPDRAELTQTIRQYFAQRWN